MNARMKTPAWWCGRPDQAWLARPLWPFVLGLALGPVASAALAGKPEASPNTDAVAAGWALQQAQVLDLLLADTQQALAQGATGAVAQPPAGSVATAAAPAPVAAPVPRLRGLYGIEPHYTVLLEVAGELKTYRPGASLPINGRSGSQEFRLVRVVDRCVVLRQGARGRLHTACYLGQPGPVRLGEQSVGVPGSGGPAELARPLPSFGNP